MDANTRHLARTADDLDSRTRALAARARGERSGLTVGCLDCKGNGRSGFYTFEVVSCQD